MVSLTPPPLYPHQQRPPYPLNRCLDEAEYRPGRTVQNKSISFPCLYANPRLCSPLQQSVLYIYTNHLVLKGLPYNKSTLPINLNAIKYQRCQKNKWKSFDYCVREEVRDMIGLVNGKYLFTFYYYI